MRARGAIAATITLASICVVHSPSARAITDEMPINGVFIAKSLGDWAKTNESYHDEATVTSKWIITTSCSAATRCDGTVTSDAGWTAPVVWGGAAWEIRRDIPDWERCADGVAFTGQQTIRFWGVDQAGQFLARQSEAVRFAGEDRTVGPSGACGVSQWLVITMPFTMRKVS